MTAYLNLLPWRQWRRERQRRIFLAELGFVFAGSVTLVALASAYLDTRIDNQERRNRFLLESIAELDGRMDEIEVLRRETHAAEGRLGALLRLGNDRSAIVKVFNELARTLPAGVRYLSLAKRGPLIAARGVARSHEDISLLMRNLQDSARFDAPLLGGIEEAADASQTGQTATFELTFATFISESRTDDGI